MSEQQVKRRIRSTPWILGGAVLAGGVALGSALYLHAEQAPVPELRRDATLRQQRGDYDAAIILLKNAIEAQRGDAALRLQLARVYLDSGDSEFAEKEAREAMRLGIPSAEARPVLLQSLLLQARFDKALEESEGAAAGGDPLLRSARADALRGLGRLDEARQLYETVLDEAPGTVPAMVGLGRLALRTGRADEAAALCARALAARPDDAPALLFQADLHRSAGRGAEAMRVYERILALNPGHRSAHILKADLAITLGQFDQARKDLDAARRLTPNSILLAYTEALLNFSQGRNEPAQEALRRLLRVAPDHMPSVLLAGALSLNLNEPYQAENHLRHYLKYDPDNLYARKMLAAALLRSGQTKEAMAVLAPLLEAGGNDVQLMALAAETHLQAHSFGKAVELFQQASALAPEVAELRASLGLSKLGTGELEGALRDLRAATELDRGAVDAGVALVRTEMRLQRLDRALVAAEELAAAHPRSAVVTDLKGSVHLAMGEQDKARDHFEKALALRADYYPAAAHLAEMALARQDFGAARARLTAFLDKNKDHVEALSALATVAERAGKPQEATGWLERAAAATTAPGPSVNLIGQYLRTGQTQKALDLAGRLQVTHPGNPDLLDLLGKGQLANGQMEEALATYRKLAVALPRSAQARMQVGALEVLLKQEIAAESSFKEVLAIQPDFPAAQLALAELYVRKGRHELALMMAGQLQRRHPKASAGHQLEGDILMARQQPARALEAYGRAFAFTPNAELTIKISHALRLAGKPDQAAARLSQWLRAHPDDLRVQLFRAESLMREAKHAQAAAQLEAIVARHPQQAVALNNLALSYQRMGDKRARAVAEKAVAAAGGQPGVVDTLAWILVEEGEVARGLAMLKEAHAKAPQARDIRYHLAVALSRSGERAAARLHLESLLAAKGGFPEAESAKRLLASLR